MATVMLKPAEGQVYRDPATKALINPQGQPFDDTDLDTVRALAVGDLVPVNPSRAAKARGTSE